MTHFHALFGARSVDILNDLIVVSIEPQKVVPLLIVKLVVLLAIQADLKISKEKVQSLNCSQ